MKRKILLLHRIKNSGLASFITQLLIVLLLFSCSEKENKVLSSSNSIHYVLVNGYPEVYVETNDEDKTVELLIPYNSSLNEGKVKLNLQISNYATSNIDPEKEYDLMEPLIIEIIAEDGSIAKYTLNTLKCEGGKSAVIVSDTQNDIIPLYRQGDFFMNANIVLDKAFNANVPIYYIMLKSLKGTDDWNLPSQLFYYDNGKIVDKDDVFDAFQGTILHKEFLMKGISQVYVIGVSSMGCVLGTCRGAFRRKYELTLISNAHAEPIGYRDESAIDECNQKFQEENLGLLIKADELEF